MNDFQKKSNSASNANAEFTADALESVSNDNVDNKVAVVDAITGVTSNFTNTPSNSSGISGDDDDAADATIMVNEAEVHGVVQPTQSPVKKRKKKRTIADQKALVAEVISLLEDGHPVEAVALMCDVTESTVHKIIIDAYVKTTKTLPIAEYALLKGGKLIRDIDALGITTDDYVRVVPGSTDDGVILKRFNFGDYDEYF